MARYHTPINLVGGFWNTKTTHLAQRCLKMILHISTFYQQPPSKSSIFLKIIFAKILFNRQNLSKQIPPWQMRFSATRTESCGQNMRNNHFFTSGGWIFARKNLKYQELLLFFSNQWRVGSWEFFHETFTGWWVVDWLQKYQIIQKWLS